jgi:hypothetical protein
MVYLLDIAEIARNMSMKDNADEDLPTLEKRVKTNGL